MPKAGRSNPCCTSAVVIESSTLCPVFTRITVGSMVYFFMTTWIVASAGFFFLTSPEEKSETQEVEDYVSFHDDGGNGSNKSSRPASILEQGFEKLSPLAARK